MRGINTSRYHNPDYRTIYKENDRRKYENNKESYTGEERRAGNYLMWKEKTNQRYLYQMKLERSIRSRHYSVDLNLLWDWFVKDRDNKEKGISEFKEALKTRYSNY